MTTVVGCGTKEPIHTNDLLYRETKDKAITIGVL
jgi:hypothetical protein